MHEGIERLEVWIAEPLRHTIPAGRQNILLGEIPLAIRREKFESIWMNVAIGSKTREHVSRAHPGYTNIRNVALFHPDLWTRMLAKIGHSFAVA